MQLDNLPLTPSRRRFIGVAVATGGLNRIADPAHSITEIFEPVGAPDTGIRTLLIRARSSACRYETSHRRHPMARARDSRGSIAGRVARDDAKTRGLLAYELRLAES